MPDLALADMLAEDAIFLDRTCDTWQEAVTAAGEGLVASGLTTAAYTAEMIDTVERLGPYIVIAPGIAIAHSRPSPAVLGTGFSWVRLAEPVAFGHAKNDPVHLVVGLAATDHELHQQALMELAMLLSRPDMQSRLAAAEDPATLRHLISEPKDG